MFAHALTALLLAGPRPAAAEDFAFFKLLTDGKASKEAVAAHCAGPDGGVRAVAAAALNLTLAEHHERVRYLDRQITNVNANPGEWTGEIYKPLCPGLYAIGVDFVTAGGEGVTDGEVTVHIHVWRKAEGGPRPGALAAVAVKAEPGPRGSGHAAVVLALASGDEIATHSLSADGKPRRFERIQFSAYRLHHMPDLAADFDRTAWEADQAEAAKVRFAAMPGN